jgi:hypothetical protein
MDFFIWSKCDARQAHNPASEAGSLVQIQPPQPIVPGAVAYRAYVIRFYITSH